jgi:ubiquinone/menaquinone biosynthesis C-methylase UbiE
MGGHICPWWLVYTFDNPLRRLFHCPEEMLRPYVTEGMTVLDAGCGGGVFSIGMAKLVGDRGQVIAVDLQQEMLDITARRAERERVLSRIRFHKCEPDELRVEWPVDFALAFWMVHEVSEPEAFFRQIRSCLKPEGRVLVAEPKFHVSTREFQRILDCGELAGLIPRGAPPVRFSRSALFEASKSQGGIGGNQFPIG